MHADSRSFISQSNKNSESNTISSSAKLSEWPSRQLNFKLLPKYRSRLLKDEILIDDEVSIQSSSEKHYLDFAPDLPHYLNDGEMKTDENRFKTEVHVFDVRFPRYRCVLSGDRSVNWKIMGLRSKAQKPNEICGLDLIRLSHTEFESWLTSGLKYKSSSAEVYLRTYYGPYESEKSCLSSVWQVLDETSIYMGDPLMIEPKFGDVEAEADRDTERNLAGFGSLNTLSGGKEENMESNGLKLQHFISQKFLYSALYKQAQGKSQDGESHVCVLGKHTLKSQNYHYTAIRMQPLLTTIDRVVDNKTYVLQTHSKKTSNRLVMKPDPKVELTRKYISKNSEGAADTIFIPLEDADVEEKNRLCELSVGGQHENTFRVCRLTEHEMQNIFFARSCLPLLEYFLRIFSKRDRRKLKPSLYFKMEKLLKRICCFVLDVRYRKDIDVLLIKGDLSRERQKALREFGVLEYLSDILDKPFSTEGFFELKRLTQNMFITKVLSLTYTTIKYIIKENPANELFCSQWLNLFLVQSLKTRGANAIRAESTLTELMVNNRRILTTRVRKETINKFIQLVSSDKIPKYLKVLRVIIICDGEPMKANQREISKLVLKDEKMKRKLLFNLRTAKNGILEVNFSMDNPEGWISLFLVSKGIGPNLNTQSATSPDPTVFKQDSYPGSGRTGNNTGSLFDFLISLTWLLGDLCYKRNYLAIESLQKLYSFSDCCQIIVNPNLNARLREAFCYLTQTLYIDVAPAEMHELPNLIVKWSALEQLSGKANRISSISASTFEESKFSEEYQAILKQFKSQLIEYLIVRKKADVSRDITLMLLLQIIEMLKVMVHLNMLNTGEIEKVFGIAKSLVAHLVEVLV